MARIHFAQKAFTAGELSPRLDARDDVKRYQAGLALLVNAIVRVQGGVERRPGTRFVAETKYSNKLSHLVAFEYSDTQAYVLEFGDLYVRFFTQGGILLDQNSLVTNGTFASDITGWTNVSQGTGSIAHNAGAQALDLTAAGTGNYGGVRQQATNSAEVGAKYKLSIRKVSGSDVQVAVGTAAGTPDILTQTTLVPGVNEFFFTAPNANIWIEIHNVNGSTGTATVDDVVLTRYVYEIASPYAEADLAGLQFVQSADTLFIVHPNHPPRKLERLGATNWAFSVLTFVDGPYLDPNLDSGKTLQPSVTAVNATGTLTAAGHSPFTADHVGSIWRLTHGATTGYVEVTSFTSATVVGIKVLKALGATTATSNWSEGAWSKHRGYPETVTLHEDRLWFGGNKTKPQTVWASKVGAWLDFTPGANAADPITATIASNKVNVIRWMYPSRVLLVGTLGDEFAIASVGTGAIQPNSIQVKRQTSHGAGGAVHAGSVAGLGNVVIFLQRSQKRLRELSYDFNSDAYVARDLSLLAEHLFRFHRIEEIAVQREPDQIVWCVRADGALLGLTYDKLEDVVGWHRHFTDGVFERVAVIPHPNGDRDQVWVIVRREINGQTKRFVEVFEDTSGYYDLFHADCALQYVGTPVSAVSGLTHLIGETVVILADGAVHPPQIVDGSGSVALQAPASVVEVGLPYTTTIQPMRPELGLRDGTSHDRKRRWARVSIRVIDTLGGKINGQPLSYRSSADPMDAAIPLFTGIRSVTELGWDRDGFITIVQDQPLPFELLAIHGVLVIEDS